MPFPKRLKIWYRLRSPSSLRSYPSIHLPQPRLPYPKECATLKEHFQKQTPMSFLKRLNVNPVSTGLVSQR